MFYTIYKTTNIINGKFYIGKHKTKNLKDGYMGSGKLLRHAMRKYGIENFHKEILHVCESEKQMNALEKILVVPDKEINYNLCDGGKGGWSYLNKQFLEKEKWVRKGRISANRILNEKKSELAKLKYQNNVKQCLNCGKTLSYEKRHNNYCNHSCAATVTNKARINNNRPIKV